MKITKGEHGYFNTENDYKFGKQITLDGQILVPLKTGHWIYNRTRDWDGECAYECSECGIGSDVDYTYCMGCGAKMLITGK